MVIVCEPLAGDGARRLCDAVAAKCGGTCAVFAGTEGDYQYAIITKEDVKPLVKDMNAALNGRGGGRDGFAQGKVACAEEEIRKFFEK